MPILTDAKYIAMHKDFMQEFNDIQTALYDQRTECLQDRRFYSIPGAQWEGPLSEQYENRPKFEVNKVHLAVMRVINEYRTNAIDAVFISKEGEEDDSLAEAAGDLHRADEQDSQADEAYDNGFEEAVGGGFGAWRLCAEYEDEDDDDNEKQTIRFEPLVDADSNVFFDLNAKRQDKSDATRCYVLNPMSPAAYKKEYGEEAENWDKQIFQSQFDWHTPKVAYACEVYEIEKVPDTVVYFESLTGEEENYRQSDLDEDPDIASNLKIRGFKKKRTKKIKVQKCHKYIISGNGVLEDCDYIAGKYIPIVPVYGKRWFVDNVERCMGHVRLAKDSQRLKNMQTSKLAEISAFSSVEKPILTPEQVAGHKLMWEQDNIKNYPYLLLNMITDMNGQEIMGPVAYTKVPNIPPAMAALLQMTDQDMKEILGSQENAEEITPNISGIALEMIQNRIDMQSFIYISNFAKAKKRSAEIWMSMARDLLVEEGRKKKGIGRQDEVKVIEFKKPMQGEDGETKLENDFSKLNHDVFIDIGPASSSKRSATVRKLSDLLGATQDPETIQVLTFMIMMNLEGEGIADMRAYYRKKLVGMGVVKPTPEESQALKEQQAQQTPDPQSEYLNAAAQEAVSNAKKNEADTMLKVANAKKAEAETEKTYHQIGIDHRHQTVEEANALHGMQTGNQPPEQG